MSKILIADDEKRIRVLLKDFMKRDGYEVLEASDGDEALSCFEENSDISLIVLDVMMPGRDGWEVLRKIRETSQVPVIMLTAKSEEDDELHGFALGADEYIIKPFSPRTLMARIEVLLRRSGEKKDAADILAIDGIRVDRTAHEVYVDGELVELSFKEFELLTYFMENAGVALSREKILSSVWNYDYFGDARTIDTHVKKLRAKLKEQGNHIRTIWGMGYKFE
ncbi:MAG: response regulator transcription factor [Lachnospiraceae bacterium]|nr:response regulator transcription factor [Lachnospiraceae bacterium]